LTHESKQTTQVSRVKWFASGCSAAYLVVVAVPVLEDDNDDLVDEPDVVDDVADVSELIPDEFDAAADLDDLFDSALEMPTPSPTASPMITTALTPPTNKACQSSHSPRRQRTHPSSITRNNHCLRTATAM